MFHRLFFSFVGLILLVKVYVAFNGLHNLKIPLRECKMNFKTGSFRCVKYIEKKTNMVSAPLPILFNKNKKNVYLWGLTTNICQGAHCASCRKRLKQNMTLRTQFQMLILVQLPSNQLMLVM